MINFLSERQIIIPYRKTVSKSMGISFESDALL